MTIYRSFLVLTALALLACQAPAEQAAPMSFNAEDGACEPAVSVLYAGQHIDAGRVSISNTDTTLTIFVDTNDQWDLEELHIDVGDDAPETNGAGNPVPGRFDYNFDFNPPVDSYRLVLELDELALGCDDSTNIAVHAAVVGEGANAGASETAWGFGDGQWDGNRWGWFTAYTICCDQRPQVGAGCTRTQGYWKNHHSGRQNPSQQIPWPISEDTELCGQTWLENLQTPPRGGNSFYILSHQWIAANLNVASGASTTPEVDAALEHGAAILQDCVVTDEERPTAHLASETLDAFNNGEIGPGHCDDVAPVGGAEAPQ